MASENEPRKKKEEEMLPRYPALAKCVLIDARHSSRTEVIKDIKASELFEVITEAGSIDHGLDIIRHQPVDACLLGPTISPARLADFLRVGRAQTFAKDCAFIVMVEKDTGTHEDLLAAGAHGLVQRPCTKMQFFDSVVRAVVAANAGGTWAAIYKKSGGHQFLFDQPAEAKARGSAVASGSAGPEQASGGEHVPDGEHATPTEALEELTGEPMPEELQQAMYAAISASGVEKLKTIVEGMLRGEFLLDGMGHPTKKTAAAIRQLTDEVIKDTPEMDDTTMQFKQYFEHSLLQWFIDLVRLNQKEATEKLRLALLSYVPLASGAVQENAAAVKE